MDSQQLIDTQFDRAVEIVQSLPKIGPIQTTYEEKLTMYRFVSLSILRLSDKADHLPTVCISKVLDFASYNTCTYDLRVPCAAATVGNVRSPRPGIWDMLGRAKW